MPQIPRPTHCCAVLARSSASSGRRDASTDEQTKLDIHARILLAIPATLRLSLSCSAVPLCYLLNRKATSQTWVCSPNLHEDRINADTNETRLTFVSNNLSSRASLSRTPLHGTRGESARSPRRDAISHGVISPHVDGHKPHVVARQAYQNKREAQEFLECSSVTNAQLVEKRRTKQEDARD
jgi:hypothetical protein